MKLFFIRHGKAKVRNADEYEDLSLGNPLSEVGAQEVEEAAKLLLRDIDCIFSSPLLRAKQTAEIINQNLQAPIVYREEIVERKFGLLTELNWQERALKSGRPDIKEIDRKMQYDYRIFGGESVEDVRNRLLKFIEELKNSYNDKTILVVTHGGIIRMMHYLYGEKEVDKVENASIHEFNI